tara:strand:- start:178 stop:366 length:189 start_codon:yes stop_codon:yes gene_type:complete
MRSAVWVSAAKLARADPLVPALAVVADVSVMKIAVLVSAATMVSAFVYPMDHVPAGRTVRRV